MGATGSSSGYAVPRYKGIELNNSLESYIQAKTELNSEDYDSWKSKVLRKYGKR